MDKIKQLIESQKKDSLEHFADIEHSRWAKWQKYLHSKLYPLGESKLSLNNHLLVMPTELYQRWERQIATPYSELSEQEKESDREQVRPYLEWHTTSLHALLDAVIEMEEKGIIEYTMKDDYRVGYNLAKTDTIATLQTIKKLL